jgi:hypothetical protein
MITKQHYCLLKWPGLNFNDHESFEFNNVPGLKEAGWTKAMYEAGAMADHRSFKEQCDEVISTLI